MAIYDFDQNFISNGKNFLENTYFSAGVEMSWPFFLLLSPSILRFYFQHNLPSIAIVMTEWLSAILELFGLLSVISDSSTEFQHK